MTRTRKTYWHLGANHRLPSDYEIVTSRLLYHVERGGFSVDVPSSAFHARHQLMSPLKSNDWDAFADPRATTYTKYVDLQRERENYVGRLFAAIDDSDYDRNRAEAWSENLGRVLSPLRFLCHGLQMVAAYVGHMAPSGRIAVAALFQCGDELRRVEILARRVAQLARIWPDVVLGGRASWQTDPVWQPARKAIEKLLVVYDWAEALIGLNVALKPVVDDIYLNHLAGLADQAGAHFDAQILRSLYEDCKWHRAWTDALLVHAFEREESNRGVVARWIDAWAPTIDEVVSAAAKALGGDGDAAAASARERLRLLTSVSPPTTVAAHG